MTFRETFRLAHHNLVASHTRSMATVVAIGVLFGLLLGLILVVQGLENVAVRQCGASGACVVGEPETQGGAGSAVPKTRLDKIRWYFDDKKHALEPVGITVLVVAMLALAFTMAHVIAQDAKTFAIYSAVGASRWQIFAIYFVYLLELCFYAAIFAILLSLAFAVIVTIVGGDYIVGQLRQAYPGANEPLLVLMGWDWWYLLVILCLFGAAPVAFLLCIDQFSTKKLALRLKEE